MVSESGGLGGCKSTKKVDNLSEDIIAAETEKARYAGNKVGDTITFGTYEQDNNTSNGSEPIEWLVLDKRDGKILVISKYGLDVKAFYEKKGESWDLRWENCSLREWLNSTFYQTAFNSIEEKIIAYVITDAYDDYNTDDPKDKVFVLSIPEARRLFADDEARKCNPTEHAIKQEAYIDDSTANCLWWLRSSIVDEKSGAIVNSNGTVINAFNIYSKNVCVRPALWIDLPESEEDDSSDETAGTEITEETISKVKAALNASGYDCGTPDGKAGPKTIAALNAYQTDNGLEITSTITQTDVNALGVK